MGDFWGSLWGQGGFWGPLWGGGGAFGGCFGIGEFWGILLVGESFGGGGSFWGILLGWGIFGVPLGSHGGRRDFRVLCWGRSCGIFRAPQLGGRKLGSRRL